MSMLVIGGDFPWFSVNAISTFTVCGNPWFWLEKLAWFYVTSITGIGDSNVLSPPNGVRWVLIKFLVMFEQTISLCNILFGDKHKISASSGR